MELMLVVFSIISGLLTGLVYFGGLWYTVRILPSATIPHGVLILSMALRLSVALLAFFMLLKLNWSYLLIALLSFLLVRQVMIYIMDHSNMNTHKT
ncbi:ATP synthase subunit I [Balneola sp. MJW-20]|uniref:N-ATPase subunit AtpR n=1 Tax=Gracilimonas aurantiaca TaxID=3234185 RepID=UPI0034676F78